MDGIIITAIICGTVSILVLAKFALDYKVSIYKAELAAEQQARFTREIADEICKQIEPEKKTPFGNPAICKVEGCDKPHYGKGFCRNHYQADYYKRTHRR